MKKIQLYATLVLIAYAIFSSYRIVSLKTEKKRLSDNQEVLMSDVHYYKTADSLSVAGVHRLTLTNREFKEYNSDLTKLVESLNIKIKRLEMISSTTIESDYDFKFNLRDSVILRDSVVLKVIECFDYNDEFVAVSGCKDGGEIDISIQTCSPIVQIIHRVPRQWWFIKWGTKGIRQEVISENKNSTIVYSEYIEFE